MTRKLALAAMMIGTGLWSCSSESARNIDTADIKNECDCVSALQLVVDELSILKDSEPTRENKGQKDLLEGKLKEIRNHCYKKFKVKHMTDCDGFNQLEKDIDALR